MTEKEKKELTFFLYTSVVLAELPIISYFCSQQPNLSWKIEIISTLYFFYQPLN